MQRRPGGSPLPVHYTLLAAGLSCANEGATGGVAATGNLASIAFHGMIFKISMNFNARSSLSYNYNFGIT